LIKAKLGDRLDRFVHALFPFLFRRPISPSLLTTLGALVASSGAAAFALGRFGWGGLLLGIGGLFDLVDGVVARHHGTSSAFGAFLDSTVDRFVDMVVLVALVLHFGLAGRPATAVLAAVALVSSVLTSYTKARAEVQGATLDVGVLERGERIFLLAFGGVTGFVVAALWIVAVGGTVTVVQRCAVAYREMERIDAAARGGVGHP
jgi:CDP-diacylglycerol--glycerol-3-phosphate 3-phosphatidyltransferase